MFTNNGVPGAKATRQAGLEKLKTAGGEERAALAADLTARLAEVRAEGEKKGAALAALLLGSIRTALIFLKLGESATYWERAVHGVFILAAVLADQLPAINEGELIGVGTDGHGLTDRRRLNAVAVAI